MKRGRLVTELGMQRLTIGQSTLLQSLQVRQKTRLNRKKRSKWRVKTDRL